MKRILIILSLFIVVLNSYSQEEGDFDYLDVRKEFNYKGVLIDDWLQDSTPASASTASRGLSQLGVDTRWGGDLDSNVVINGVGYPISLGTVLSLLGQFEVNASDVSINSTNDILMKSNGQEWTFDGSYIYNITTGDSIPVFDDVRALVDADSPNIPFNIPYTYDPVITDSRPGPGFFRLNNSTYSLVTQIFIDNFDNDNVDKSDFISLPDTGSVITITDGINYANFRLTGETTMSSSYYKYGVTYLSNNGLITGLNTVSFDISNNVGGAGGLSSKLANATDTISLDSDTLNMQEQVLRASVVHADTTKSRISYFSDTTFFGSLEGSFQNNTNNNLQLRAISGLDIDAPAVRFSKFANNTGDQVYIGTNGVLVAVTPPSPGNEQLDINAGPIAIPIEVYTDLGVSITLNVDYENPTFEWQVKYENLDDKKSDVILALYIDGVIQGAGLNYEVDGDEIDFIYGSATLTGTYNTGQVFTLRVFSSKLASATDILEKIWVSGGGSIVADSILASSSSTVTLNGSTLDGSGTTFVSRSSVADTFRISPNSHQLYDLNGDLIIRSFDGEEIAMGTSDVGGTRISSQENIILNAADYIDLRSDNQRLRINSDTAYFDGTGSSTEGNFKAKNFIGDKAILNELDLDGETAIGFVDAQTAIEQMELNQLLLADTNISTHIEGRFYYDSITGGLVFQDKSGGNWNLGAELGDFFYNPSASTIPNGRVVQLDSNHVIGDYAFGRVLLAGNGSLDSCSNILGIATQDILPSNLGRVVFNGRANDINTLDLKDQVYLGHEGHLIDTSPPPKYLSVGMGNSFYQHATNGAIQINVNHPTYDPLPNLSMAFSGVTQEIINTAQNAPSLITNATNDLFTLGNNAGIDYEGDTLTVLVAGNYYIATTWSFYGDDASNVNWDLAVFVNGVEQNPQERGTTTGVLAGNMSVLEGVYLDVGDTVSFKVTNTSNGADNATFVSASVFIQYVSR